MRPPGPRTHILAVSALLVLAALAAAVELRDRASARRAAGLAAAIGHSSAFSEKAAALARLIDTTGAVQAQAALVASGIPFGIEEHMLMHEIGHALYREAGAAAIARCSDYFHFGCYHGVIHSALTEHGNEALASLRRECAALGEHMVARCAHGVGHTLLVRNAYDLPAALAACDAAGAELSVDAATCYSGVFMENGLGASDGAPARERWVRLDDPAFPCTDPRIAEPARGSCWEKQAFILEQAFAGDSTRIGRGCASLPPPGSRAPCFRTFAGWILYPRTRGEADRVFALCREASPGEWYARCLGDVAAEAFEAGDRTRLPFELCSRSTGTEQESCYGSLLNVIRAIYPTDAAARSASCNRIRETDWSRRCRERA